jgi:hypothetical protein
VPMFLAGFGIGMCLLLIWFCLCGWTFRRLRMRHSALYESLGSPTLFRNNSPRIQMSFLMFLLGFSWRRLGDGGLIRACASMVALFTTYLILFVAVLVILKSTTSWRR